MSSGGIPLIGQKNAAMANMRLNLAGAVLPQLAAIVFARSWQAAVDKDQATGGDGSTVEFTFPAMMAAQASLNFADCLLIASGMAKMPDRSENV
jgi:hypothetical protein